MVAAGVVLASVILVSARGRLPRGRAVVFGNSSHLSFGLRIEDFVKSALVIVMSSRRHTRLPGPPVTTRSATANLWSAIVL